MTTPQEIQAELEKLKIEADAMADRAAELYAHVVVMAASLYPEEDQTPDTQPLCHLPPSTE